MSTSVPQQAGQSLFIVDRDWLRQGSKARKSWTGNVRNRSLYGLAIQVTEHDVPEKAKRGRKKTRSTQRSQHRDDDSGTDSQTEQLSSVRAALMHSTDSNLKRLGSLPITNAVAPRSTPTNRPSSADIVPKALPSFIPLGFERIKGLECYLDYYLDVIGTLNHPVEARFSQKSNSIRSSWFPLAFQDDLWLQNITTFSALHHAANQNKAAAPEVHALMSSFLAQLNDRISKSDLSDGTIASVSCLALLEHHRGNVYLADVHTAGLAELVRLRGGLHAIDRVRRTKIVRADVVCSVDNLKPPALPRMQKVLPDKAPDLPFSHRVTSIIANQARRGVSSTLVSALWTLNTICQYLDSSSASRAILDPETYYENIFALNHDLLNFEPQSSFDAVLRVTIINFTQPMFRMCAFSKTSCRLRSAVCRKHLDEADLTQCDIHLGLWILFTAYMTSNQTDDAPYFKAALRSVLDDMHIPRIGAWPIVREHLSHFIWTASIHDQPGKQFYEILEQEGAVLSCRATNFGSFCSGPHHIHGT